MYIYNLNIFNLNSSNVGLFYIIPKLFSIIFAIYNQYYKSLTNVQINIFLWYKLNLNKNNRKNDQHIPLKPIFDKKNKSHSDIDIIVSFK